MRRRRPEKREILPDPLYNDLVVAKFINNIMSKGKKSLAEKIFYTSIEKIKKSTKVSKRTIDGVTKIERVIKKLPKNHSIFIIESINPMMDTNLIKEMNRLIQKRTKNVVPFGAIPGTAPEIGLAKNNILPYLKNKNKARDDAEIINWDTQRKTNNKFNLKIYMLGKFFLTNNLLKKTIPIFKYIREIIY